jgi:Eco57I restriction-modification methylase
MTAQFANLQKRLQNFDFKGLFTQELMWNHFQTRDLEIRVDGLTYTLTPVAQRGMAVYECVPPTDADFPKYAIRRKIDTQVSKTAREHIIVFHDRAKTVQVWQWVKREAGKPSACREQLFYTGQSGDALVQKIQSIAFSLEDDPNVAATVEKVTAAFDVEKITKKFYELFKKEHDAFLSFVKGIPDKELERWYVSVMLNRLMFIYFIQKKEFLGGDQNYLRNKLNQSKNRAKDKFYRDFLCRLFFEGFAKRPEQRSAEAKVLLGQVPYLNGGLFLKHQIEQLHGKHIDIPDKAFDRIFDFFEQYDWHLDDRPTRTGREINPDVLGYVFEKYINQREMGAYYTKEDITEYIGKNTIIPVLTNMARNSCRIAFEGEHSVWRALQNEPDRYIHAVMLWGMDKSLPKSIAAGLHDASKRTDWNKIAEPEYALPSETWRDTVARRTRCEEIRKKLAAGEVRSISDLITYNLDIRRFAEEVIANCEGTELLRAFYKAIRSISVLDPACGSGAFLFAALNLLERLYDTCLVRMQAFVDDLDRSGEKHSPDKFKDFRQILEEMNDKQRHPSPRYFILKSIILNNLYGVDIMEEATEICKLRLFLKLVAQVNVREQIEPLPDIDFNICAGNTLVGYATEAALDGALSRLGHGEKKTQIKDKADAARLAFERFRQEQVIGGTGSPEEMAVWKKDLSDRLSALREELDDYLSGEYNVKGGDQALSAWKKNHDPFHWFVTFFGIMSRGGFDVIIGNPPYVEVPKRYDHPVLRKHFKSLLERWSRDEDLYTVFLERSLELISPTGCLGMILPLSLTFSTKKPFQILRSLLKAESGSWWWSHFDRIPSALFGNEVRTRCTIAILHRKAETTRCTTALLRWESDARQHLFSKIGYANIEGIDINAGIPKVASQTQADSLRELVRQGAVLGVDLSDSVPYTELVSRSPNFPQKCVFVGGTAYNWFPAWRDIPPTTTEDKRPSVPARTIGFRFMNEEDANVVFALLCSSLGYWWWAVASDGFNLKKWLLERFPLSIARIPSLNRKELARLGETLRVELRKHYVYKDNKGRIGNYFLPACDDQIQKINAALSHSTGLSQQFFDDVHEFNLSFSRAEGEDDEEATAD